MRPCKELDETSLGRVVGPSDAPGSIVSDAFFSTLDCTWTCAGSGAATCTAAGAGDIGDTVDLPVGGAATYTAVCAIDAGATGTVTNTATVAAAAGVTDPDGGNNTAVDQDTFTPEADLAITKDDGVNVAQPGAVLTYTIAVSNAGPSDVLDATVEDLFPPELLDCRWSCAAGAGALCTAGPVSGDLEDFLDLETGGSAIYTAICTVDPDASFVVLSNTATVTAPAGVTDTNTANNTATDQDSGVEAIFVDGFESGDTSAWSSTVR